MSIRRRHQLRWIAAFFMTIALAIGCKKVLGLGDPEPYGAEGPGGNNPNPSADGSNGGTSGTVGEGGEPTCDANLARDPKHCGRCNHDCLGAACQGGMCAPVSIGNIKGGTGVFVIRQGNLYTADNDEIIKFDPNGNRSVIVSGAGPAPIAMFVDEKYVVWSSWGDGVEACALAGCGGPGPLTISTAKRTGAVVGLPGLNSTFQYVWVNLENSKIVTVGPDGGAPIEAIGGVDESACANFAQLGSTVYFTDPPRNRIISIDSQRVVKSAAGAEGACAIVAHRNNVFFSDEFNVWSAAVKADGMLDVPFALANGQFAPKTLAADDNYVYWAPSTQSNTSIFRCKRTGCDLKPEAAVSGLPRTMTIAVDDKWIYFSLLINGTIGVELWKVAK